MYSNTLSIFIPSDMDCKEDLERKVKCLKPIIKSISIEKDDFGCDMVVFRDDRIKNFIFENALTNILINHQPKIILEKLKILKFFN